MTSVWNAEIGWTCPPFPLLKSNEFVLAIKDGIGKSSILLENYLQQLGFMNQVTYLGRNTQKDYERCLLLYPLRIYQITLESDDFEEDERWASDMSNKQLVEDITKLAQDEFVPMASIIIVTPELQKLLTSP